eukprot:Opistho-1_new@31680
MRCDGGERCVRDALEHEGCDEARAVERREVVVEEEKAVHEEERQVAEEVRADEHAERIARPRGERTPAAARLVKLGQPVDALDGLDDEGGNGTRGREPPHEGIADEVYLAVVGAHPVTDAAPQKRPGPRVRGIVVCPAEVCVGNDHRVIDLKEEARKRRAAARTARIALWNLFVHQLGVGVALHPPRAAARALCLHHPLGRRMARGARRAFVAPAPQSHVAKVGPQRILLSSAPLSGTRCARLRHAPRRTAGGLRFVNERRQRQIALDRLRADAPRRARVLARKPPAVRATQGHEIAVPHETRTRRAFNHGAGGAPLCLRRP